MDRNQVEEPDHLSVEIIDVAGMPFRVQHTRASLKKGAHSGTGTQGAEGRGIL